MLLLADVVYDLPQIRPFVNAAHSKGLFIYWNRLAVSSARMAVGHFTVLAQQSGTCCQIDTWTVWIVLNGSLTQFSLAATNVTSTLRIFFLTRCTI